MILEAEFGGVMDQSWNSKISLIFALIILKNTSSTCHVKEIRLRIIHRMDLW